ncbi:hypothetical protein FH972_025830 [Carpinus fangiana]|uniref:Uncharacterized protein n=1 Tax=Carpinus fangiana TaxID=176857 RepID=A0A5N6L2K2_9ROSI|nr:hypothetical protein FH972_025830 [Carpinus fangiana]
MLRQAQDAVLSCLRHARVVDQSTGSQTTTAKRIAGYSLVGVAIIIITLTFSEWFHLSEALNSGAFLKGASIFQGGPFRPSSHLREHVSACDAVPDSVINDLRNATTKDIAIVYNDRNVVSEADVLQVPAHICILVTIPQKPLSVADYDAGYTDPPVAGKGPDLVHLLVSSDDVVLTFPPLLPVPDQQFEPQHDESIIYSAAATILNNGTYTVSATHEFSNWKWAQEWHVSYENDSFSLGHGLSTDDVFKVHDFHPDTIPSKKIIAMGLEDSTRPPICNEHVNAGRGRWYKQKTFPFINANTADETGYAWQGDDCSLDYFSPDDVLTCLSNKTIHIYGDSMIRRETKAILNGGNWCLGLDDKCQDNDDWPGVPNTKLDIDENGAHVVTQLDGSNDDHFGHDQINHIDFGMNTSIFYTFVTTVTNQTSLWMKQFYDDQDLIKPPPDPSSKIPPDYEIKPGAKPRPPLSIARPDAVILGFGAWDQAFTDHFDSYENRLVQFRETLLGAYQGMPIIMRMANSWCCRSTGSGFRRFTGGRVQEFDDRTRRIFGVGTGGQTSDGRIRLLDPVNMNGREDILSQFKASDANHPRASHVRTEVQMLLHSLCLRDPVSHKLVFRD